MKKKICFYHIYDKEGIIADYVLYWLSQLRDNNFEIVIVINGYINESSYSKLINYSKKIYIRENVGYDAMAYKEMLTVEYGQQKIMQYDECLLLNDTVFGPFIALSDIINKMDGRYDLWGISAQNPIESYYGENKDLPYHIQSYFLMFESDILKSNVFWDYWNDLVISESYQETIENFEFKITKIALENDFKVGAYVDRNYEFGKKAVDLMERPMIMLSEYGIPILKKKLFTSKAFVEWDKFPINIYGYELIKYVKNHYPWYPYDYIINLIERLNDIRINDCLPKELMDINPYRMKKFSFWEYKIISEELYRFLKKNYMVWIYGAGKNARLLISMLEELGIAEIKGIIVTDKACNPANYNGYKIYGIDDIENIHKEAIVITPKIGGDDIKKELDKRNVVNSICIFQ